MHVPYRHKYQVKNMIYEIFKTGIFYSDFIAPAEYLSGDWWSHLAFDSGKLLNMRHLIILNAYGINDIRESDVNWILNRLILEEKKNCGEILSFWWQTQHKSWNLS